MELENYFEFIHEDAIRIKGTRVNIETVLRDYLEGGSPEEMAINYPTLSLEQIHATILYYLANQSETDEYLSRVRAIQEKAWREDRANPSEFTIDLRNRIQKQRQLCHKNRNWTPDTYETAISS